MANKGGKKQKLSYTSKSAAAWRSSFDSNLAAQERAYSSPYNNGIIKDDVTSIYNAPSAYTYKQANAYTQPVEPEDKSFWQKAKDFVVDDIINPGIEELSKTKDLFNGNAARMFMEKLFATKVTQDEEEIRQTNEQLDDVAMANNYLQLLKEYKQAKDDYEKLGLITDKNRLDELAGQLDQTEKYIRERGKYSDTLLDIFVDNTKKQKVLDDLRILNNATSTEGSISGEDGILARLGSAVLKAPKLIGLATESVLNGFDTSNITKQAIKNTPKELSYLTDKYFKSYKDSPDLQKYIFDIEDTTAAKRNSVERDQLMYQTHLSDNLRTYKNGNWLFDPKKIDKNFRKNYEDNDAGLIERAFNPGQWAYNVADMGSSYSMFEQMAAQFAYQGASKAIGQLVAFAAGGAEGKAAKVGMGVLQAAQAAGAMYLANRMREGETESEVLDAYSSRLLQYAHDNKLDISKLYKGAESKAKQIGVDPNELTDLEKIQLALAYNINSGNSHFETEKNLARQGLSKVYNDNMALSTMDYVEMLPFLEFGGKAAVKSLGKDVSDRVLKTYLKYGKGVSSDVADRFINANVNKAAVSLTDNLISRAFADGAENIIKKTEAAHVVDFLKKKAAQSGIVMASEGIEEGQQHLLQQRYQRGEYDDYSKFRSSFDTESVFNDARLALEAVGAYYGLNYGDPDNGSSELRKAMVIGAIAGGMGAHALGSLSNILSPNIADKLGTNPNNTRNLISQLRADSRLQELIASNYAAAQDDNHVGIFFKALQKGSSRSKLEESLNKMKNFKGDLVDNAYIDDDISLLNTTDAIMHNKQLLNTLGIKKLEDTYEHRNLVQDGVRAIQDFENIKKLDKKNIDETNSLREKLITEILGDRENMSDDTRAVYDSILKNYESYSKEYDLEVERQARNSDIQEEVRNNVLENTEGDVDEKQIERYIQEEALDIARKRYGKENKKYTQEDYVENRANLILGYMDRKAQEAMLDELKNQHSLNKLLREETGTDINTSRFGNVIRSLERRLKESKARDKDLLKEVNAAIDERNKEAKAYNAANSDKAPIKMMNRQTIDDVLSEYQLFEGQSELEKLFQINALNQATIETLMPIYTAYRFGSSDPTFSLSYRYGNNWKNMSHAEKEKFKRDHIDSVKASTGKDVSHENEKYFQKAYLIEQRRKTHALDVIKKKYDAERKVLESKSLDITPAEKAAAMKRMSELEKEAAKEIINARLDNKHERKRIAHKEFLKNGGITPDDINRVNTENEDPAVREVLQEEKGKTLEERVASRVVDDVDTVQGDTVNDDVVYENAPTTEEEVLLEEPEVEQELNYEESDQDVDNLETNDSSEESPVVSAEDDSMSEAQKELYEAFYGKKEKTSASNKRIPIINTDDGITDDVKSRIQEILDDYTTIDEINNIESGTIIARITDPEKQFLNVVITKVGNKISIHIEENPLSKEHIDKPFIEGVGFNIPEGFDIEDGVDIPVSIPRFSSIAIDSNSHASITINIGNKNVVVGIDRNAIISKPIEDIENTSDKLSSQPTTSAMDTVKTQHEEEDDFEDSSELEEREELSNDDIDIEDDTLVIEDSDADISLQLEDAPEEDNTSDLYGFGDDYTSENDIEGEESGSVRKTKVIKTATADDKEEVYRRLLDSTFFYMPDSTKVIDLVVDNTKLNFKYPVKPNSELNEKLTKPGWFSSTNKYYVVSGKNNRDKNSFTVSLIIEDAKSKSTYITAMRTPSNYEYTDSRGVVRKEDGIAKIRASLSKIGVDESKFMDNLSDAVRDAHNMYGKNRPRRSNYNSQEAYEHAMSLFNSQSMEWYYKLSKDGIEGEVKRDIEQRAREMSAKPGQTPLTEEQIDEQIENLIKQRDEIIDAYCEKNEDGTYKIPSEVKTDVLPLETRISNGKITKNDGTPHSIGETGNLFGIPADIKAIDEQVKSGKLLFGFGRGMFADDPFTISSINGEDVTYTGRGYSGTIYIMVKGPSGNQILTPITLSEQRFDVDNDGKSLLGEDIDLSIDPETGTIVTQKDPSAAELLLYMICGKLNNSYIPGSNTEIMRMFADFIINNGDTTTKRTGRYKRDLNRQPFLADKQISVVDNHGLPSLQIVRKDEHGQREAVYYPIRDIFNNTESSINLRKEIVEHIATNMHWNTDVDAMTKGFPFEIHNLIRRYFENNKDAKTFSIGNNKILSFNKEDLFDEKDGVLKYNNVNVLSWMIKSGKLLTTTKKNKLFEAPFVYATGVKTNEAKDTTNKVVERVTSTKTDKESKTVTLNSATKVKWSERNQQDKIDRVKTKLGIQSSKMDEWLTESKKEASERLAAYKDLFPEHGGVTDFVILDIDKSDLKPRGEGNTQRIDNYVEDFKNLALKHIEEYSKHLEKETGRKLDVTKVVINDKSIKAHSRSIALNKVVPQLLVFEDGTSQLNLVSVTQLLNQPNTVTGVFSQEKQKGSVDVDGARKWLAEKLGIDPSQVTVIDGIMKSVSDEDVFGLMNIVTDILNNGDVPSFMFRSAAGWGIQYHEAWHYVNLLLHNDRQREVIYSRYIQAHPKLKNKTYRQIEELIAEDFRRYAELQNGKGLLNTVKRAFDNILKFSRLFRNKYVLYDVFKDINTGKYKTVKIDSDSMKQFKTAYKTGAPSKSFIVSGINNKALEKLDGIDTYQQFYQSATALANKLLDDYSLDTVESIKSLTYDGIKLFLEDLRNSNTSSDPTVRAMVTSISKNPDVFVAIVNNILKSYSIEVKDDIFSIKDETQIEESNSQTDQDTGDKAENSYDKDPLSVSKKDNVAARAKLFLGQIKKAHLELNPITGENEFVYDTDPIFGSAIYVPFGEAWNSILNNLWDTDSYGKRDESGHYDKHSIRGVVKRLAEASVFFKSLDLKLDSIEDDIQLQSQIHSTIRSQMAQMMQIWIKDPKKTNNLGFDDGDLSGLDFEHDADSARPDITRREWEIVNDNQLKAIKQIPKIWSQQLVQAGLVNSDKNPIVSAEFVRTLKNKEFLCRQYTIKHKYYPKSDEQIPAAYVALSDALINMFRYLAIPIDHDVLEQYVNNVVGDNKIFDKKARYRALTGLVDGTKVGSIHKILSNIKTSVGKPYIKSGSVKLNLDRVFSGYKNDSQIAQLAKAYNDCYPSPQQFSITAPDGTQRYPISENNTMSDMIRNINHNTDDVVDNLRKSEYCKHSILLDVAMSMDHDTSSRVNQFKLNYFVGLRDLDASLGKDYHGITQLEDYLAKMYMTQRDMLILPTMADKKTWYAISHPSLKMPHSLVTYENYTLDDSVLSTLRGYFMDELNSIKQYCSEENIQYLIKHPENLRKNFHGALKNGTIAWGGNGGKFRYFSDIFGENEKDLNALIQREYIRQQRDIDDKGKIEIRNLRSDSNDLDGYEYVRKFLNNLESKLTDEMLNKFITLKIRNMTASEMKKLSEPGNLKLGHIDVDGKFVPTKIPVKLLEDYAKRFIDNDITETRPNVYMLESSKDLALSLITNNVLSSIISIIEIEKVFTGDPAFYKNKFSKKEIEFSDGIYNVDVVSEKHSDKIKRLGAVLSPGQKVKLDYSEQQLQEYPELTNRKYTVLNISDIKVKSEYLNEIRSIFTRQYMIDFLETTGDIDFINSLLSKYKFDELSEFIKSIYTDSALYKSVLADIPQDLKTSFEHQSETNTSVYGDINVADAQVIIRPELYRKIRIGLGDWSFDDGFSEYSDEEAYNILQNDPNWQEDPEKSRKVAKLQLYPLKMSYFQNTSQQQSKGILYNLPIYNKMAIFPAFKYMLQSDNGKVIYDRMNKEGQEIDMIAFDSAVKVGANQQQYSPYKRGTVGLENMDKEGLLKDSDKTILQGDNIFNSGGLLQVQIQDLDNLRMQLNTEAHKVLERAFGTQALKLLLSNISDDLDYGIGKDGETIKGSELRSDIIKLVNALTGKGIEDIKSRFGFKDGKPSAKAVVGTLSRIVKANGVGANAEELIQKGGLVEALGSRLLFEQSISKVVNKNIADLNLNGGSAVQQSVFGLVGSNVVTDESGNYHVLNGGKKLNWINKDNSMEIMLSINFFRDIIPVKEQTTYNNMRQWLIDHDVIKGTKSDRVYKLTEEQIRYNDSLDEPLPSGVLPTKVYVELENNNLVSIQDVMTNIDKLSSDAKSKIDEYLHSVGFEDGINTKRIEPNNTAGVKSNPKPIGIGYRIPTQGMSSIFAFTVADVLPTQSGDIIIVPEEFTAQTGSDFDVDKIFVAMKSFTKCVEKRVKDLSKEKDEIIENNETKAIRNTLIQKYIDVLTDNRVFIDARGSIDTVTEKIKGEFLPELRAKISHESMYELMPSFQSQTKSEFTTGKDGIGPYALSVTNLAFTQTTHLTIDFKEAGDRYKLNPLDQIKGEDDIYISAWLSAMVNAHVDVAKDPYISLLNINPATYEMSELLLRAGKGISTFSFLAQPILKKYARMMNSHNGIYIDEKDKNMSTQAYRKLVINELIREYKQKLSESLPDISKDGNLSDEQKNELRLLVSKFTGKGTSEILKTSGVVMDYNLGIESINNPNTYKSYIFQLQTIVAFRDLIKYAEALEELVKCSQIDTKKFGNNITEHYNFINKYRQFTSLHKDPDSKDAIIWKINSKEGTNFDSSKALDYYFDYLWMNDKLFNATYYTRAILDGQLFTASPEYNTLYHSIMYNLMGDPFDFDAEENPENFYRKTGDKKLIQAISSAINSIARNNMLFNSPVLQGIKTDDYKGYIDFTMNGDKTAVYNKLLDLIYGNPDSKDQYDHKTIFIKYANFVYRLKNGMLGEEFNDLLDEGGNIKNEFLNYYIALTDNKFQIGRFSTRTNYINIDPNQRQVLESALYQLLTHKNELVRRLFRDIVFYDYYSTYNSNSISSIFDIVPIQFKQQYIQSITESLRSEDLSRRVSEDSNQLNIDDYLDQICRNFWYDDKIVPTYSITKSRFNSPKVGSEAYLKPVMLGGEKVAGVIITAKSGNHPYIKVNYGKEVYIYKKSGSIIRGEKKSHDVYIIAPKLGIHSGGVHQYEFLSGSSGTSLYGKNMLPETFKFYELEKAAHDYISSQQPTKKRPDPYIYTSTYSAFTGFNDYNYYQQTKVEKESWNLTQNSSGDVRFTYAIMPKVYAKSKSNILLSFNTNEDDCITIDTTKPINEEVNKIAEKIKDLDYDVTIFSIYADGKTIEEEVHEDEIEDFMTNEVKQYGDKISLMFPNISAEDKQERIQEHLTSIYDSIPSIIRQQKLNDYMDRFIKTLISMNFKIGSTYAVSTEGVGEAITRAAQTNKMYFEYGQPAYIVLNKKDYTQQNMPNLVEKISKFDYEIENTSIEEEESTTDIKELIDSGRDAADEVAKTQDEVSDDIANILKDRLIDDAVELDDHDNTKNIASEKQTSSDNENSESLEDLISSRQLDESVSLDESQFDDEAYNHCTKND